MPRLAHIWNFVKATIITRFHGNVLTKCTKIYVSGHTFPIQMGEYREIFSTKCKRRQNFVLRSTEHVSNCCPTLTRMYVCATLKLETNWMYLRHPITPQNSYNFSHIYNWFKRCNWYMNNARAICAFWMAKKRGPNHWTKKTKKNNNFKWILFGMRINVINGAPYGIFHVATEEYWMECFGRSACVPTPQSIRCTHTHSNKPCFRKPNKQR